DARIDGLVTMLEAVCRPAGSWSNERVVIFTEYAHTLEWLQRVLLQQGYGDVLAVVQGSAPTAERELVREGFRPRPAQEAGRGPGAGGQPTGPGRAPPGRRPAPVGSTSTPRSPRPGGSSGSAASPGTARGSHGRSPTSRRRGRPAATTATRRSWASSPGRSS